MLVNEMSLPRVRCAYSVAWATSPRTRSKNPCTCKLGRSGWLSRSCSAIFATAFRCAPNRVFTYHDQVSACPNNYKTTSVNSYRVTYQMNIHTSQKLQKIAKVIPELIVNHYHPSSPRYLNQKQIPTLQAVNQERSKSYGKQKPESEVLHGCSQKARLEKSPYCHTIWFVIKEFKRNITMLTVVSHFGTKETCRLGGISRQSSSEWVSSKATTAALSIG